MHEWHTRESKNPLTLINHFIGFEHSVDEGHSTVKRVNVTNKIFSTEEEASSFVCKQSYYSCSDCAYLAAYTTKKLSKGFQNAFNAFLERNKEYTDFENNLTIAYGRVSSKATCPTCGSSISLKYGRRFKLCPVCGSKKIISDSNWKTLETKERMRKKAAENLEKEATKNDITFICGIEWHC